MQTFSRFYLSLNRLYRALVINRPYYVLISLVLLTTIAASAPVSEHKRPSTCACREPREPDARSSSRFEYPLPTSTTRSRAAAGSGARPRFVWTITPVALSTGRIEAAPVLREADDARPQVQGGGVDGRRAGVVLARGGDVINAARGQGHPGEHEREGQG